MPATILFTSIHHLTNYPLHLLSSSNLMIGGKCKFSVRPCYISKIFNVLSKCFLFFCLIYAIRKEINTSDYFYTQVMVLSFCGSNTATLMWANSMAWSVLLEARQVMMKLVFWGVRNNRLELGKVLFLKPLILF